MSTTDGACPCGSGRSYGDCCAPAHSGTPPATAEGLMRSRYSAYARRDTAYVLASWHPGTRPDRVDPEPGLRWVGLEVVDTEAGGPEDARGIVEFRAHWRRAGTSGTLAERSRFVRQSGRWWYLDGMVSE